jgi:hydroxyethylthiazole kinase-like uncharacterized protein yjeF
MKILSAAQIREIEDQTIVHESISSLELMRRAAAAFCAWFAGRFSEKTKPILIVCGPGNNGGDGLLVAEMLTESAYCVEVWIAKFGKTHTKDCEHNLHGAKKGKINITTILSEEEIPDISKFGIIIDAIFGIGLNREIAGIARALIQRINNSGKPTVSVDVPSGLHLNRKTDFAIQATETVTFQIPKLALFFPENHRFVGNLSIVGIGLSEQAISTANTNTYLIDKQRVKTLLKPLSKYAHKGTQGHALVVGGSLGKIGAVCLASKAALKSGCGLVTAYVPKCGTDILQIAFPEAMVLSDKKPDYLSEIKFDNTFDAIGIGVGMGQHKETQRAFCQFLAKNKLPLVIDADGLNILSQNPDWLALLPPKTILTPHPKELSRLTGKWNGDDFEKIEKTVSLAKKFDIIIVVKGAHTLIVDAENIYVNSSGTSALATAGSGDVLTGMITGLLAQGYTPIEAAQIAVYLHGLTANLAENHIHPRSFVASDIIDYVGGAYFEVG